MHLALCSALKAPLPLPGSYFSAPLAAPSSSGCFCGRGTVLETWLPFIALNVTRRSLGFISLPRASLLAVAWQEGMRFLPAPFCRWITPCLLSREPCGAELEASRRCRVLSNPEEGIRMVGGGESLWSPSPAPL